MTTAERERHAARMRLDNVKRRLARLIRQTDPLPEPERLATRREFWESVRLDKVLVERKGNRIQ